jgi:hypothetical protein
MIRPAVKEVNNDELSQYLDVKEVALVYLYKGNNQVVPVSI